MLIDAMIEVTFYIQLILQSHFVQFFAFNYVRAKVLF